MHLSRENGDFLLKKKVNLGEKLSNFNQKATDENYSMRDSNQQAINWRKTVNKNIKNILCFAHLFVPLQAKMK